METTTLKKRIDVVRNERLLIPFLFLLFAGLAVLDIRAAILEDNWLGLDAFTGAILSISAITTFRVCLRVFRFGSVDQNYLSWNREGLICSLMGACRHWPWREVSSFDVIKTRIYCHKLIGFSVPTTEDVQATFGRRFGAKAPPGRTMIRIGDAYDLPLEEIATRLNECRDQALSAEESNCRGEN